MASDCSSRSGTQPGEAETRREDKRCHGTAADSQPTAHPFLPTNPECPPCACLVHPPASRSHQRLFKMYPIWDWYWNASFPWQVINNCFESNFEVLIFKKKLVSAHAFICDWIQDTFSLLPWNPSSKAITTLPAQRILCMEL